MSDDWSYIVKLEKELQQLRQYVDGELAELRAKDREQKTTIAALLDVLSDAGQLDRTELAARIQAAAIEHNHESTVAARDAQDVWDAAKGKP